ncbi:MAG TPA: hypothetical protein VFA46_03220 [Actinomycetes bacterium]|nr:hypothetical protein [Actinomycetes bacterium]
MPKTARPLTVSDQDLTSLRRWTRSSSIRAGLAQRARIVLATPAPRSWPSPSSHHPSNWASPTGRPAPSPAIWG